MKVDDVDVDPRVGDMALAFHAIGSRTVLAVPLIKGRRFTAILFLHDPAPRLWSENDVTLTCEVAERTWSAVGRAKAEAERRLYTARLDFLDALIKATSPLNEADAILRTSTRMLGEKLEVSVCAYADMDADQDGFSGDGEQIARMTLAARVMQEAGDLPRPSRSRRHWNIWN